MFLYYFIHVPRPYPVAEQRLREILSSGIGEFATPAGTDRHELRVRLGFGSTEPRIGKVARISIGEPHRLVGETTIPITWETAVNVHVEATGAPAMFPKLDGSLVVAGLGPTLTQIALQGTYRPPLGSLGRGLDRAMFHRVAEASIKALLDRIGRAIEESDGAIAGPRAC